MQTIKEKVMKAWADETVVEVIPKVGTFQSPGVGEVLFVSEGKTMFAIWSAKNRSRLEYRVDDIANIRFVDEGGMNIKQQLEQAKEGGYPVRVTFFGCEREGLITKNIPDGRQFMMSVQDGQWHTYQSVVSVAPVEPDVEKPDGMRTVCEETLTFLKGQIDWNSEDLGSLGEYIKTEYVYNLIDDLEKALTSNKVRMNWPFLEESTQDGANREMDEEDARTAGEEPDDIAKERWEQDDDITEGEVICHGRTLLFQLMGASDAQMNVAVAAPQMFDALETLEKISTFSRMQTWTVNSDTITVKFNPDGWRIITDAIAKARGEENSNHE